MILRMGLGFGTLLPETHTLSFSEIPVKQVHLM